MNVEHEKLAKTLIKHAHEDDEITFPLKKNQFILQITKNDSKLFIKHLTT